MANADGSVVIPVEMNVDDAQKQLAKLKRQVLDLEDDISKKKSAKSAAEQELSGVINAYKRIQEVGKRDPGTKQLIGNDAVEAENLYNKILKLNSEIEKYDDSIRDSTIALDATKNRYGEVALEAQRIKNTIDDTTESQRELSEEIEKTSTGIGQVAEKTEETSNAMNRANGFLGKFAQRVGRLVSGVFVFSLISSALRNLQTWLSNVIKTNDEARSAIARLKGAFLTLVQPLVSVVIPAFTTLVNVLATLISYAAKFISMLFGTTAKESAKAAEGLYNEQKAISGVGGAAKKASKQLAAFDEINKLSGEDSSGGGAAANIEPDFSDSGDKNWLSNMLGEAAGWVTAALLLGGIALVAIGACTGNLGLVMAGLLAIGSGIVIGQETGTFENWVDKLGLNSVGEFVTIALLLGGIALVAIGAMSSNLLLVLLGLGLLAAGIVVGNENGTFESWKDSLGLDGVGEYVSIALLLGGIALVAIGAMTGNMLAVIAGLGLLAAGVIVAKESGALESWAEKLGLESVFDYVVVAIQLAGIALIAIGAAKSNLALVIAGGVLLAAGIAAEAIGEEKLASWWEKLKLTNVQQWVSVALLLVGIALIAIGAAMGNVFMVLGGMVFLAVSTAASANEGNMKDWVTTLGLEKVMGWVTAGLMLAGLALIVFGICTANMVMVLAGIGLLGAGVAVGITSGTFSSWIETIVTGLKSLVKSIQTKVIDPIVSAFKWFYNSVVGIIEGVINGFIGIINGFIRGINWVIETINKIPGVNLGTIRTMETVSIPRLAKGAVIPPNREFLAVLGDQKNGTNIETPLATMVQAFRQAFAEVGYGGNGQTTVILELDRVQFGKVVFDANNRESRRIGVRLVET